MAIFACLGMMAMLFVPLSLQRTATVVVTARPVRRGAVIRSRDVATREVPDSPIIRDAMHASGEAVGRIAQTDLPAGQPLFPTHARDAPVVPSGHTVLDVMVANGGNMLTAGDTVSLMSSGGCAETAGMCTLADTALVMGLSNEDQGALLTVALPPDAALNVMKAGEVAAIVAAHR